MRKNGVPKVHHESLRLKIMDTAMPLFKRHGVKAVKMDDIAAAVGISKRTLYEIYHNKEDMLCECLKHHSEKFRRELEEYSKSAKNEMDIVAYFLKMRLKNLGAANPLFYTDIHKYPKIVDFLQKESEEYEVNSDQFMKNGTLHGFFKDDINFDIVHKMEEATIKYVMQTKMYEEYPLKEIFRTMITIYLRGCCTDKGLKYLEKALSGIEYEK